MVQRELPTKSCLDPCSGFLETWVYGRRTDGLTADGRLRHDSSSADNVKQSWKWRIYPGHFAVDVLTAVEDIKDTDKFKIRLPALAQRTEGADALPEVVHTRYTLY